jgi:hypothetical protein
MLQLAIDDRYFADDGVATGRVLRSVTRRMGRMERRPLGGALLFCPIIILRDLVLLC